MQALRPVFDALPGDLRVYRQKLAPVSPSSSIARAWSTIRSSSPLPTLNSGLYSEILSWRCSSTLTAALGKSLRLFCELHRAHSSGLEGGIVLQRPVDPEGPRGEGGSPLRQLRSALLREYLLQALRQDRQPASCGDRAAAQGEKFGRGHGKRRAWVFKCQ